MENFFPPEARAATSNTSTNSTTCTVQKKGQRSTIAIGSTSHVILSLLSLLSLKASNTTALFSATNTSTRSSNSRRQWIVNGLTVVSGVLVPAPATSTGTMSTANAVDELPTQLRRYTALAPLGSPSSTGAKTKGLSFADIAAQLTKDLTQGSTGSGGYFVSGDLTPEIFRDDCVFIDPTNSVSSLSRYRNALRILFDPDESTVRLVSPLVINESERTLSGRIRSWGVLQLPWRPRVSSYETSIVYSIDEDGLIYSQAQEWSISASEALWETFTPGSMSPPFSRLPRPPDEPAEVTELFELVNGHLTDSYSRETRVRIDSLVDEIVEARRPWKREDLPGSWALMYLRPGPEGGGIDRSIPFPELWFNRHYQVVSGDSVSNVRELVGPAMEVRVGGELVEEDATSLETPKRFRTSIEGGAVCLGRRSNAPCLPLPIKGEDLFDGVYIGERLRVGKNLNDGGATVVQVKVA